MMSLTASPDIWHKFAALFAHPTNAVVADPVANQPEENRKAEQDVFNDMIWSNPDAISSELGAYYMMHMCGGRR